jgi:hypothetical protein
MGYVGTGRLLAGLMRRPSTLLFCFLLLFAQPGQADDGLKFFKNHFVTGDYVVGGTSLWRIGTGTGLISVDVTDVPENADVLSAFLYLQTAEKVGHEESGIVSATFRGVALDSGENGPLFKAINTGTEPCWSVAWPGGRRLVTYRADVLRFLPIVNGKYDLAGPHSIRVPDAGVAFADVDDGSGILPRAVGASLVIVYRNPDPSLESNPLKAIVIYDGGRTKKAFETMSQQIKGFYQSSSTSPVAKMTHIVSDGRPFLSERVFLGAQLIATNPFVSALGPKWDNKTFNNLPLPGNASSATVSVTPHTLLSECLTYSAIVFSTTVQDTDDDGLIDIWESSTDTLYDPNAQPLPNLKAMGATPSHKDLFLEVGYMHAANGTLYGGVSKPAHSHLPTHAVWEMLGNAFASAPVTNPDGFHGIRLHVDLGDGYPSGPANTYIIRDTPGKDLARGGEAIDELATTSCIPDPEAPWVCQFYAYPGTVGWKSGFRFFRDELLNQPALVFPEQCEAAGSDGTGEPCERRFDANRSDMFHYALFAHALGVPREDCLNEDSSIDEDCQDTNADFRAPRTNSGVADFPGGDVLVTLGGFNNSQGEPIGTDYMQAATVMHELGHNFELTHGGVRTFPRESNCKPNHLSIMNYLFQLRGLFDSPNPDALPVVDFSGQSLNDLLESALGEALGLGGTPDYRSAWYAPVASAGGEAVTKHCDGSPILDGAQLRRVDGTEVGGPINWNGDNDTTDVVNGQDINFDGSTNGLFRGSNDWAQTRLNQVGSRRNVGGWFLDLDTLASMGPLSLDVGRGDLGRGDLGRGDLGRGDLGRGDLGRGDLGRGDLGRGDLGRGDLGRGDLGRGDLGRGDLGLGDLEVGGPDEPLLDIDFETARDSGALPVANPDSYIAIQNTVLNVAAAGVLDNDDDVGSTLTAVLVSGPSGGTLDLNPDGSFTFSSAALGISTFTYTANIPGQASNEATVTITVVADQAPAGMDKIVETKEDSPYVFKVADFGFHDPNEEPDDAFVAVKIATLPGSGILKKYLTPVSAGAFVSKADIAAGKLRFFAASNANGTPYASFTFQVKDSGPAGSNLDLSPNTITINVISVNDAPAGTNKLVSTPKNTPYTFTAADFGYTDPHDSPANLFLAVKITTLCNSSVGTLKLNGYPIGSGTMVLKSDIDAGKLKFVPTPNKTGTTNFTFQVKDDGGTGYGGVNLDPSPNTMTVKVVYP